MSKTQADDAAPEYAEYQLSCSEALVAATLALMTAHAQSASGEQRGLLAHKIGANLSQLRAHECLSPQFRMMLGNLCAHWQLLQAREGSPALASGRSTWHAAPAQIQ
jgi:hypothetical protein